MRTFEGHVVGGDIRIGIVAARFNEFIVGKLVAGALDGLKRHEVDEDQIGYFESLPLHPSQVPVKMTKDYTIYQYHLVPTFDFRQEVLRHGPSVEVLAPEWFRDEVAEDVRNMMKRYD